MQRADLTRAGGHARPLVLLRRAADPVSVAAITTVPGAACTLVVSRVDLAVGPFVGPNQAVLGRIGPITTRPRRYRILPICRYFRARRRHERHASHARGRWFETSRAHRKTAFSRYFVVKSPEPRVAVIWLERWLVWLFQPPGRARPRGST